MTKKRVAKAVPSSRKSTAKKQLLPAVVEPVGTFDVPEVTGLLTGFVKDVEEAARNLILQGEQSGNALMLAFGNQLNVALTNFVNLLGEDIKKSIDQLDDRLREMTEFLQQAVQVAKQMRDTAYELEATTSLDVEEALGRIPFVKSEFVLKIIQGITVLKKERDYELHFIGTNMGTPTSKSECKVDLFVEGDKIAVTQQRVKQHKITLFIPAEILNRRFDESAVRRLEVSLAVDYRRKRWGPVKDFRFKGTFPFFLTLFPRRAGSLEVNYKLPDYGWTFQNRQEKLVKTGNHHQTKKPYKMFPYTATFTVDNDYKIDSPNWVERSGSHVIPKETLFRLPSPRDPSAFREMEGVIHAYGQESSWVFSGATWAWKEIGEHGEKKDVANLYFGDLHSVVLPAEARSAVVTVRMVTRDTFRFLISKSDSRKLVVVEKIDDLGSAGSRVWFRVKVPGV